MALSPEEQETIISWGKGDKVASIFTTIPIDIKHFQSAPEIYKQVRVEKSGRWVIAAEFECEKRYITLRKKVRGSGAPKKQT